jgi:hypothetical protein
MPTNARFMKIDPLIVVSHSLGWARETPDRAALLAEVAPRTVEAHFSLTLPVGMYDYSLA